MLCSAALCWRQNRHGSPKHQLRERRGRLRRDGRFGHAARRAGFGDSRRALFEQNVLTRPGDGSCCEVARRPEAGSVRGKSRRSHDRARQSPTRLNRPRRGDRRFYAQLN